MTEVRPMAEFLDKLKVKIDKGITTVNVKSKEIIQRQKIRLHLSELEAERKLQFQELGKLTYGYYRATGGEPGFSLWKQASPTAAAETLDKWEEAVLEVLGNILNGRLRQILFEDTPKQFKVTAKTLYEEVEKLIPESEKKGQNLQWVGRVLGKFGLAAKKVSKRIEGERETVYAFDKETTRSMLVAAGARAAKSAEPGKPRKGAAGSPDTSAISAGCKKLSEIDSKIDKLEKQLKNIGEQD
jgi:hypothetical protein